MRPFFTGFFDGKFDIILVMKGNNFQLKDWFRFVKFTVMQLVGKKLPFESVNQLGVPNKPVVKKTWEGLTLDNNWVLETLEFFRSLGFFGYLSNQSRESWIKLVKVNYKYHSEAEEKFDNIIKLDNPEAGLLLLDPSCSMERDLEAGVYPGEKVYLRFIEELAFISNNLFQPLGVVELWDSDLNPSLAKDDPKNRVTIKFKLNNQDYVFKSDLEFSDWIDDHVIRTINSAVKNTGYSYSVLAHMFPVYYFFISDKQKSILQSRGWEFSADY